MCAICIHHLHIRIVAVGPNIVSNNWICERYLDRRICVYTDGIIGRAILRYRESITEITGEWKK